MIIRKIEEKDAENYLNMLKQLERETKFMLYEPEERKTTIEEIKDKIIKSNKSREIILIVEEDDKLVGFLHSVRGSFNRVKHSSFVMIGIIEDYTGKGIGTKLFIELEKWARENEVSRLDLTVSIDNSRAINLYKKMGFQIEGIMKNSLIVDGEYNHRYLMAKYM